MLKQKRGYMLGDESKDVCVAILEIENYEEAVKFVLGHYAIFEFSEREDFSLTPVKIYSEK